MTTLMNLIGWIVLVAASMFIVLLVMVFVVIPIDAGRWAQDRFGQPWTDAVVLRQDAGAEPLWICADGDTENPRNCLPSPELVELLRAHGRAVPDRPTLLPPSPEARETP